MSHQKQNRLPQVIAPVKFSDEFVNLPLPSPFIADPKARIVQCLKLLCGNYGVLVEDFISPNIYWPKRCAEYYSGSVFGAGSGVFTVACIGTSRKEPRSSLLHYLDDARRGTISMCNSAAAGSKPHEMIVPRCWYAFPPLISGEFIPPV